MIEIHDLSKTYKGNVQALRDVTLTIGPGMFGLLGANGAGKTTLMRIIAGLLQPTQGDVTVFGHDMSGMKARQEAKAHLGYLPQEFGLYPNLTATEFLDYIAILKGITDRHERQRQISGALEQVRLSDVANRQLKTYSGGMKRRVGIAQAILGSPKLLIVDEPTSGLDPEERVRLRNLLGDMAKNCTVILSTHIVEDISQSCNALVVMHQGRVIFHGAPVDLIGRARGKVWQVTTDGDRPAGDVAIVSMLQMQNGVQYRVLGDVDGNAPNVAPVQPSLEDGYVWLMQEARAKVSA